MNSYERYIGMIQGKKVDIIPRIPILMHFAADYIGVPYSDFASNYNVMTKSKLKLADAFEIDLVDVMSDPYREMTAFGGEIEYRQDTTPKCVRSPLGEKKDLNQLSVPDINNSERLVNAIKAIETYKIQAYKKYSITGWVEGPVAEAANLRGTENFLIDLMDDKEYSNELMDIYTSTAILFATAQIKAGADTIGIGDAIASQVSLETYAKQIFPHEFRLVQKIHDSGGFVRLHICGDINRLLPVIADLGVDILDCDHMVDMELARKLMGQKCVLSGNIDPVSGVLQGNPKDINSFFVNLYNEIGNPFFINGGCEIPRGTPIENLKALCQPIAAK